LTGGYDGVEQVWEDDRRWIGGRGVSCWSVSVHESLCGDTEASVPGPGG